MDLADKIVALHRSLEAHDVPHAFGGALALAWCTERARGTIDIDVNIFVGIEAIDSMVAALPGGIVVTAEDRDRIERDGQTRLWWGETPIDIFFNTTRFHEDVAGRTRTETFGGIEVPFLSCIDIAVFKAFFNRTRDWADLEEMAAAGTLDFDTVSGVLAGYLGVDERITRLNSLRP